MIQNADSSVNSKNLMMIFVTLCGTIFAVALLYSILATPGNNLSKLTLYLALGCFVAGLVSPRGMLFVFIVATGYLDLLKRLLILFERPNMLDLYYVMGLAPLIMLGILCGVLLGGLMGRYKIENRHWKLFAIATAFILVTSAFAFRHSGTTLAIKRISNGAAYSYLLFVLPILFHSWQDLWKLCRFAIFAFIPVGCYAIYQSIFGLSAFEIEYLESGLTIMVKELRDVRPRPFSTMNAAHTMAYMAAILMMFSYLPFAAGSEHRSLFRHRWVYSLSILFYFVVCFVTMARSGHFMWMAAFGAMFAFASQRRTAFFYGIAISAYISMVVFAEWMIAKLPVWDAKLNKSTDLMMQATRIQTFYDRLYSYSQLKKAETYSLFGLDHEIFVHDAITETLAKYGFIPLSIGVLLIAVRLKRIHKAISEIVSDANRRITCLFLAIAFSIAACDVFFGNTSKVFPISGYLWAAIGGAMIVVFYQKNEPEPVSLKTRVAPTPTPTTSPRIPPIVPSGIHVTGLTANSQFTHAPSPTHGYSR